jgi:hypothetical protein
VFAKGAAVLLLVLMTGVALYCATVACGQHFLLQGAAMLQGLL